MENPNGDPSAHVGNQAGAAGAVAEVHPSVLQRAGGAVLHFFTEQMQTPPTEGMSEHFGHASKRNELTPQVYIPPRRLGRH